MGCQGSARTHLTVKVLQVLSFCCVVASMLCLLQC